MSRDGMVVAAWAVGELRELFQVAASVVAVMPAYQFDRHPQLRRPRNVGEKGYGRFFSLTAPRRARRRRSQLSRTRRIAIKVEEIARPVPTSLSERKQHQA